MGSNRGIYIKTLVLFVGKRVSAQCVLPFSDKDTTLFDSEFSFSSEISVLFLAVCILETQWGSNVSGTVAYAIVLDNVLMLM